MLNGKEIGGFTRRAEAVMIVDIYRYIYVLDGYRMCRWIRMDGNEEGNIGRK